MNKRVLIGIPCGSGFIPTQTVNSLLQLHKPKQTSILIIDRQRVDKARNFIVKQAIENRMDYILFLDDDNPVPNDTLLKMMERDKDIVTCPILTRNPNKEGKYNICCYNAEEKDVGNGKTLTYYNFIEKFDEEFQQVDATGTGCLLVKRKVFLKLFEKYEGKPFEFGDIRVNGQRRVMSEDVEFCERAKKEGFEIWCDTTIRPIHLGPPLTIKYSEE
jgi:glycosyltransferase involved in cell wall biosynthesis